MISFSSFIKAIHSAIVEASDQIAEKNIEIFNKYFEANNDKIENNKKVSQKSSYSPKTVSVKIPQPGEIIDKNGNIEYVMDEVHVEVPLITLIPMKFCNIEKATFSTEFNMEVLENDLKIDLKNSVANNFTDKGSRIGKLEITLTPQDTPEGLQALIESYESVFKRQIP